MPGLTHEKMKKMLSQILEMEQPSMFDKQSIAAIVNDVKKRAFHPDVNDMDRAYIARNMLKTICRDRLFAADTHKTAQKLQEEVVEDFLENLNLESRPLENSDDILKDIFSIRLDYSALFGPEGRPKYSDEEEKFMEKMDRLFPEDVEQADSEANHDLDSGNSGNYRV